MTVERQEFRNSEHDEHGQQRRRCIMVSLHVVDRVADERGVVAHHLQRDAGRQLALHLRRPPRARRRPPPPCWRPTASCTSRASAGALVEQRQVLRLLDPVHHLRDVAHEIVRLPRASPGCRAISAAPSPRAATRTMASVAPRSAEPPGSPRSRVRSASTTSASESVIGLEPRAVHDHLDLALGSRPPGSRRPRPARSPAAA